MKLVEDHHDRKSELEALVKEELGEERGADLKVRFALGEPATSVTEAAEQLGVAMVVMGTRGRTGIAHLLLGSTAERTLRRSSVPVLCTRG